jgi:hypothetical protein
MTKSAIPSLSIRELFERTDDYVIPVYQRNYAWGYGEVKQLIDDINDYASDTSKCYTPYYIGSLVVFERDEGGRISYETIDGQQRLTTLVILLSALKRWFYHNAETDFDFKMKLKFFSRPRSEETLRVITSHFDRKANFVNTANYNPKIQDRYFDAFKILKDIFGSPEKAGKFYGYLLSKVHLIRISVHASTDLNHYFEIMNNRGEQLEKHEVLKAKLLAYFKDDKEGMLAFQKAWDAVSDMERYVQYGFKKTERNSLFGKNNWNSFQASDFNSYKILIKDVEEANAYRETALIIGIVNSTESFQQKLNESDESPERFNTVINFQGFLLHVLRVQTQQDVPLDDKRLLETFAYYLKDKTSVEKFIFNLLRLKFLYDQFVIKREFVGDKDRWSLKKMKWQSSNDSGYYVNSFGEDEENSNQEHIKMLLSMFHVSLPSMNYKHWLSASLNFLYSQKNNEVDGQHYQDYMTDIARSYFYDRILSPQKPLDYFKMIFNDEYKVKNNSFESLKWDELNQGILVENYAFNYTDFLLWKESGKESFDFSFRSSVEHFYPQNPIDGKPLGDDQALNCFGNLCLLSGSKNSRLSNYLPMAKKDHYKSVSTDSLKLKQMMDRTKESTPWDVSAIINYFNDLKGVFEADYNEYESSKGLATFHQ